MFMSKERQAVADYVADLAAELAGLARQHNLDTAAYMLEIAAAEAASCKPRSGSGDRLPLEECVADLVPEG